MLNKLLSLFILAALFGGIYFFYYYFFIINKGNLTIHANVGDYKVEMYSPKLKTAFSTQCKNQTCELIDLAPFQYQVTLSKKGYKDLTQDIILPSKQTLELSLRLEKQLMIEEIKPVPVDNVDKQKQLEKFREISNLQKMYAYFDIPEFGYFYFQVGDTDKKLHLKFKDDTQEKELYSFDMIEKEKIDLQKVYQSRNEILIVYGDDKILFDVMTGQSQKVFFPQEVSYVKKFQNLYMFVNSKGTFLYDTQNQKIEYFYTFKDFLYFDAQHYFGVIYKDEVEKLKNYNLTQYEDVNLIVKYNFETKEMKVLETTSQDITKIVKEGDMIYFYDSNGTQYKVKNIDE